jgi:hypothetical protein
MARPCLAIDRLTLQGFDAQVDDFRQGGGGLFSAWLKAAFPLALLAGNGGLNAGQLERATIDQQCATINHLHQLAATLLPCGFSGGR